MLLLMTATPSERNRSKLCQTPEGAQALEDGIVAWVENTGAMPSESEMDVMVTLLLQSRSRTYMAISQGLVWGCIILLTVCIVYGSYIAVIRVMNEFL